MSSSSKSVRIVCSHCDHVVRGLERHLGQKVMCGNCRQPFVAALAPRVSSGDKSQGKKNLMVGLSSIAFGLFLSSISPYVFIGFIGVGLIEVLVGAVQLAA